MDYLKELRLTVGISSTHKEYYRLARMIKSDAHFIDTQKMIEFVDKIERRKGLATIKDCWGELLEYFEYVIWFYNSSAKTTMIDRLSPEDQFLLMYAYVLDAVKKIKDERFIVVEIYDKQFLIKKEDFYETTKADNKETIN